jgi:nucleoside-diphosphate kinase
MVLEGANAIEVARSTMGATKPAEASPGTIRADFGMESGLNLVHGSDGAETAAYEVPLFFSKDEILSYERAIDRWIYE